MLLPGLRRVPHGARGLKRLLGARILAHRKSRPSRGARIETEYDILAKRGYDRRVPHGARGLKHDMDFKIAWTVTGRVPHGARGLKPCSSELPR